MIDKAFLMIIIMEMKCNSDIELRGCSNRRFRRLRTNKCECSSPVPDLCLSKYDYVIAEKEKIDKVAYDLPSFFLKNELNKNEEVLLLKLTGTVVLLPIESNQVKWRKHLKRER